MKVVQCFSGGLDSTVLLWHLRAEGHEVLALSVDYGQRHRCELTVAVRVAALAGVEHRVADLTVLRGFLAGSSQTDDAVAVPRGHYANPSMRATVVPNRNMILLSVAAAWAASSGARAVAFAAHAGDHPVYPDCRPAFADALAGALALCHYEPIELLRPFIGQTKAALVRLGVELGAPLGETWSCYDPAAKLRADHLVHCGVCGTCVERREAFGLAGVADPTEYA